MNKNKDQGFTLVELLIVIVILGILATVTVFAVQGITDKGKQNACDVEVRALETAVEAYYVDNGQAFPTTLQVLNTGSTRYTKTEVTTQDFNYDNTTGTVTFNTASGGKCANAV